MKSIDEFVQGVFRSWDGETEIKKEIIDPRLQDYKALSQSHNSMDSGRYTLNPETQGIDFERLKVFTSNLMDLHDAPIYKVMRHVMDTYGDRYYIPGIEYWKWVCENPKKNMAKKDRNWYFFPGSMLCGISGYWSVPFSEIWRESRKDREALWLLNFWNSFDCRIVLLEKP